MPKPEIDGIAEAAGFSKGAFYSNFRSKQELAFAVLERMTVRRIDLMVRAVASAGRDPAGLMHAINTETVARQQDRLWNLLRLELLRQSVRDSQLRVAMAAHCAELLAANARLFADLRERLDLKPLPDARVLADMFLAAMLGASLLRYAGVEITPVETLTLLLLTVAVADDPMALAATGEIRKKSNGARPARARRR